MYIIVCFFAFLHGALKIQCMTHAAHRVLWQDSNVGSALVGKASCGDVIKLQVRRRGRVGWLYHIYMYSKDMFDIWYDIWYDLSFG